MNRRRFMPGPVGTGAVDFEFQHGGLLTADQFGADHGPFAAEPQQRRVRTDLMEAIGYLATLSSHRVSSDAPLLRFGSERAMIRAKLVRGEQSTVLELEINSSPCQPRPDQPQQSAPGPGHSGYLQDSSVRPRGPGPGKGDPSSRRRFWMSSW